MRPGGSHEFIIISVLFLLFTVPVAFAEGGGEKTISGEVVSVQPFTPVGPLPPGLNLQLKTEEGTIFVLLGCRYVDDMDFDIEVTDNVEVTGLSMTYRDEPVIIADEVMVWRYLPEMRESPSDLSGASLL